MTELPVVGVQAVVQEVAASVTALPETGLPLASVSVTVIVEVAIPFARTEVGLAVAVDLLALTVPAVKVTVTDPITTPSVVSVAVRVTDCANVSVTVKVATPLPFVVPKPLPEIVALPPFAVSVTDLPPKATLLESSSVTVTV
jgi:hypothetical protein